MMKQTEIGLIPDDWEVKRLGDVAFLKSGKTIDFSATKEGIYPCYGGNGIRAYIPFYSHDGAFPIIGRQGELCGNVQYADGKFYATEHAVVCTPNNNVDSKWLYFQLIKADINKYKTGNAQPGISVDKINSEVFIPFPPIAEQQRIAKALSDVDALISTTEKLIQKKKNIKQGAMQNLLTGKKRLPAFGPQTKSLAYKQTELGPIPEDWEVKSLGEMGYCYTGLSGKSSNDFIDGNYKYITFLNVLNNTVINTEIFEKVKIKRNEQQNKVLKGDLLFNTSSETPEEVGFCSLLNNSIDNLYLNSFCFGFRLRDESVYGLYLSYLFRSSIGRILMMFLAQGSTRYNLSKDKFLKSNIYLPSLEEQNAIANALSNMDKEIETLNTKLEKYRNLKTAMMQQLLTGKIRLVK